MKIEAENRDHQCCVRISGEMTIYAATELKERLWPLLRDSTRMEVNLAGVEEFDTSGVQLLLWLKREAERTEKSVQFVDWSEAVTNAITVYGLADYVGGSNG